MTVGFTDEYSHDVVRLTVCRGFMSRAIAGLSVSTDRLRERFGADCVGRITSAQV